MALATWQTRSLEAGAGIDPSWRVALHLTLLRDVAFGGSFAWTYGPLGFLAFPIAVDTATLAAAFVFVVLTQLTLAYLLVRRGGVVSVALAYLALALPIAPADHLVLIALALSVIALREAGWERWYPIAGGVVAGLALLVKTNTGALAVVIVIAAALALRGRALLAPLVALVAFSVGWVATGSSLGGIPGWVRLSAGLVTGYSPAMQYEQPGLGYEYGYAAVAVAVLAVATVAAARRVDRPRAVALGVVAAAFALAFFKEGFVRHDAAHSATFFAAVAVGCVILDRTRVIAVAALAVAIFAVHRSGQLDYAPVTSARSLVAQARDVALHRDELVRGSREAEQRSYELPEPVLRALRGRSVHVLPVETAAVAAYGLRWRPLPVVQDYSVYTHGLDAANMNALESPSAPERLLRGATASSVNGRLPVVDAPGELRSVLCRYRQVIVTAHAQVVARGPDRCGPPRTLAAYSDVPTGARVPIPDGGAHDLVVARIHLSDTFRDRVRGLFFKPHEVEISLSGGPYAQLVAATAGDGIVMHVPGTSGYAPAFGGAIDWRSLAVATHVGGYDVEFVAYRIEGPLAPSPAERPAATLGRYVLRRVGSHDEVTTPAGKALAVAPGGGFVDYAYERRGVLVVRGWAADVAAGASAQRVLVYADGALVFSGRPNVARPDVAGSLGKPGLARSGYEAAIPIGALRSGGARRHLRVIALAGGRALEATYLPTFGWR